MPQEGVAAELTTEGVAAGGRASRMPVPFTLAGVGKPSADGLSPAMASCPNGAAREPAACAGPCQGHAWALNAAEFDLHRVCMLGMHVLLVRGMMILCLVSGASGGSVTGRNGQWTGLCRGALESLAPWRSASPHTCLTATAASRGSGWISALGAQHLWLHVGKPAGGAGAVRCWTAKGEQRRCSKCLDKKYVPSSKGGCPEKAARE